MTVTNLFAREQCKNNVRKANQTTTLLFQNLIRLCSKVRKEINGKNLNLLS